METVYIVTHPEVVIDPDLLVPDWSLSEVRLARIRKFVDSPILSNVSAVFSSTERKAIEAAEVLSEKLQPEVAHNSDLGENDRSATGFLPKDQFEAAADNFFSDPGHTYLGWERAQDAQSRIVGAINHILSLTHDGDIAVVSHGAVSTLYKWHLKNVRITRAEDQPSQENYSFFDRETRKLIHDWLPIA